jgi:hypothetical protein
MVQKKRKEERKKKIEIFLRVFSFWQYERKYKMNTTGKYLLCIEDCAEFGEVLFN